MFFCCLQKDQREESISVNTTSIAVQSDRRPASRESGHSGDENGLEQGVLQHTPAEDVVNGSVTTAPRRDGSSIGLEQRGFGHSPQAGTATPVPGRDGSSDNMSTDRIFENDPRRHTDGSLLPPEEFCVKLPWDKDRDTGLGLVWEVVGEMVIVDQIKKGAVASWGAYNPGYEVRPGDRVVEVNGVAGKGVDIIAELRLADAGLLEHRPQPQAVLPHATQQEPLKELILVCRRPRSFDISLIKHGSDLGVALLANKDKLGMLRVTKMKDSGLIPEWNRVNRDRQVLLGDRIVQVNNTSGQPSSMLDVLKTQQMLELRVLRPH